MLYYFCISTGRGNYAHFTREIQGKDLTVMTVDATILTARHGTARHGTARHGTARHGTINQSINQSERSFSTLFCQALFTKFHRKPRDHDAHGYRRNVPMSVMVFLRSVWSDPGAPPGNKSNAPPGRMKNGNNYLKYIKRGTRV